MTEAQIQLFIKVQTQLESCYREMGVLSKKIPEGRINKFKLNYVNQLISEANKILISGYKPFSDFESFDEIDMPFNSDVVFMLSHYLECMENLHKDNCKYDDYGSWYWIANGNVSNIQTYRPKGI